MQEENEKTYKELQLEELREIHSVEIDMVPEKPKDTSGRPEDAEIAGLYADAAEYEGELEAFKRELDVIKTRSTSELVPAFAEFFSGKPSAYAEELKAVVLTGWKQRVEEAQTHPYAQLECLEANAFGDISAALIRDFPAYEGDFEVELKQMLIERWERYIEIKKEHIKEETSYIKTLGLKPDYAKRVYNRYHGIK